MEQQNDNPGTALAPIANLPLGIACNAQISVDAKDLTAVQIMLMETELERQVKNYLADLSVTEQAGRTAGDNLQAATAQLPERWKAQAEELQAKLIGFEEKIEVEVETSIDEATLEGEATFHIKEDGHSYGSMSLTKKFKLSADDPVAIQLKENRQTIAEMEAKAIQIRKDIAQRRKVLGNMDRMERMARGHISIGLLKSTPQGQQLLAQLGFDPAKFESGKQDVLAGVIG